MIHPARLNPQPRSLRVLACGFNWTSHHHHHAANTRVLRHPKRLHPTSAHDRGHRDTTEPSVSFLSVPFPPSIVPYILALCPGRNGHPSHPTALLQHQRCTDERRWISNANNWSIDTRDGTATLGEGRDYELLGLVLLKRWFTIPTLRYRDTATTRPTLPTTTTTTTTTDAVAVVSPSTSTTAPEHELTSERPEWAQSS
ncbi:hypothetical protein EX30DRAFT_197748 [Ascodesmis nigricans]|uniref:Uncharacterized protein n=1 Tax=Ascodesmis nigricans TaxID=341454 RepID=A0A4S2MRG6_9PEZI|nr:hypothetical protein EX30DRAFT_197748 [Ascodesmis nigricans]